MSASVLLQAIGLNIQPNQLDPSSVPPGSLAIANNVIIKRDNVLESRRGYRLYGESFGTGSDRAKQLATYKSRILRHFAAKLQFDTGRLDSDGNAIFADFAGSYTEPQPGRRIRYIEANSNFYFTTSDGVQKISAKSADQLSSASGYITPAGGIKALDATATLDIVTGGQNGFLQGGAAVAYRIVWGTIDANDNLILGSPSSRVVVYNSSQTLLTRDFNNLLGALDAVSDNIAFPSLISDGDYVATLSLPANATGTQIQSAELALAAKLDNDILYADQVAVAPEQISGASINGTVGSIAFTNASQDPNNYFTSGQQIFLNGFTPTSGVINGPQTISSVFGPFSTTGDLQSGQPEITQVVTVADVSQSLAGVYWLINSANDTDSYYVWYKVSGVGSDPLIPGRISILVNINTNDTDVSVATATRSAILGATSDFSIPASGTNTLTITTSNVGPALDASAGTSTFTVTVTQQGEPNNVITNVASTSGIFVGSLISGTGIPVNTYVTAIGAAGANTITISSGISVNATGVTLNFGPGLTFITSASGVVGTNLATINSYTFGSIPAPPVPDNPATAAELAALQAYLSEIITRLQLEPSTGTPPTISADSQSKFISSLDVTNSANVILDITIPQGVTSNYFFQIYRSPQAIATGTAVLERDVVPSDELQQVYEAVPTALDISQGHVVVEDITPDAFLGAFLYTDATNGQGILQSNDIPPACLDLNYFKNVAFYANTRRKHALALNLLGVANMLTDFNNGITPKILITNGTISNTYSFVTGLQEITQITTTNSAALNSSGMGSYFLINSGGDGTQYYVWYQQSTTTDPMPLPSGRGIEVAVNPGDTAAQVAEKTANQLIIHNFDFNVQSVVGNVITVETVAVGYTTGGSAGTTGFSFNITQQGRGENPSTNQVLLSTSPSPAVAVDETARSLVRVINRNVAESVYAYYLSGVTSPPGQMNIESRDLSLDPFYIIANNSDTGLSFNPDLSPEEQISSISVGNPTVITTSTPHGLINQDKVLIVASNSTPIVDGLFEITYISPTSFSIPVNVTVAGTVGAIRKAANAPVSDNEVLQNRIYFSKNLQPEAVPLANTIDVGAKDKAILRIFPLRDSLFVFKEDGLFRISGEQSPFSLALFDSSVICIAPDSVDVSNNLVFAWTTKGIHTVSEAGVNIISRPIDTAILKLATEQYINFRSATWGIGYESDNSYTVYTVTQTTDVVATLGFRYSTLTHTWTNFVKSNTCGVINFADDKQYLGAGDTNFIEQERKDFTRYDYADREVGINLTANDFFGAEMRFSGVPTITPGDVLVQNQLVTIYDYNAVLEKMDFDSTLSHDYVSTLTLVPGLDLRTSVDTLITKVANDPIRLAQPGATSANTYLAFESILGVKNITAISAQNPSHVTSVAHGLQTGRIIEVAGSNSTPSIDGIYAITVLDADHFTVPFSVIVPGTTGTFTVDNEDFRDIQSSYNSMIETMNNDTGVAFGNYSPVTMITVQESIIENVSVVNNLTKVITVNLVLPYTMGPMIIFRSIPTMVAWAPQTLGDALGLKHMREFTLIFENRAFTDATMNFATDLLPRFIPVDIPGDGNGIFGYSGNTQGFGSNFFGGGSNSAPFRTYIPRDCQRCRYIVAQFNHNTAREEWAIFGLSLTGEISQSTRAYR